MNLREMRCLFSSLISELVIWGAGNGYDLAYDEVKRTPEQAEANAASGAGISNSLHLDALAADLLLYVKGIYLSSSEAHAVIGAKWKTMHPLCRWGGDFKDASGRPRPDGGHYSLEWQGRK